MAFDTTLTRTHLEYSTQLPPRLQCKRREDETLTLIDTFCTEKLLPKLNDSKQLGTDELMEQAESIPQLVASLARAHETFLVNLNQSTSPAQPNARQAREAHLDQAVSKLSDTSSELFLKSHTNLTRSFESIASGIESINRSLRQLGERQIPGAAPKKPGLSSPENNLPCPSADPTVTKGVDLFSFMSILACLIGILTLMISVMMQAQQAEQEEKAGKTKEERARCHGEP